MRSPVDTLSRIYDAHSAAEHEHKQDVIRFLRRNRGRFARWLEDAGIDDVSGRDAPAVVRLVEGCYENPAVFFFREFPDYATLSEYLAPSDVTSHLDTCPPMSPIDRQRRLDRLLSPPLRGPAQRDVCRGLGMLLFSDDAERFAETVLRANGEINTLSLQHALQRFGVDVSRATIDSAIGHLRAYHRAFPGRQGGDTVRTRKNMLQIRDRLHHEIEQLASASSALDAAPHDADVRDEAGHAALAVARATIRILLDGRYLGEHMPEYPNFVAAEQATLDLLRGSGDDDPSWEPIAELARAVAQCEEGHPFSTAVAAARGSFALLGRHRLGGVLALLQILVLTRYLMPFDDFVGLNEDLIQQLDALDVAETARDAERWRLPLARQVKAGILANVVSHGCTAIATDAADDPAAVAACVECIMDRLRDMSEEAKAFLVYHEAQAAAVALKLGDDEASNLFWRRFDAAEAQRIVDTVVELEDCPALAQLVATSADVVHPGVSRADDSG
jgi:hypothetical protein